MAKGYKQPVGPLVRLLTCQFQSRGSRYGDGFFIRCKSYAIHRCSRSLVRSRVSPHRFYLAAYHASMRDLFSSFYALTPGKTAKSAVTTHARTFNRCRASSSARAATNQRNCVVVPQKPPRDLITISILLSRSLIPFTCVPR